MDYKSVLEEQIRELQKIQDENIRDGKRPSDICEISKTILELIKEANKLHRA